MGNLEVGSCDNALSTNGVQDRAEISQWNNDDTSRWIIAHFEPIGDGSYSLQTGSRILKADRDDFYRAVGLGFTILEHKSLEGLLF